MSLEHAPNRQGNGSPQGPSKRIVRQAEVCEITGLSRTTIWRLERDGRFPKRRRLGPNSVGHVLSDILDWIESCEEVA